MGLGLGLGPGLGLELGLELRLGLELGLGSVGSSLGGQREVHLDDEIDKVRADEHRRVRAHHGLAVDASLEEDVHAHGQAEVLDGQPEAQPDEGWRWGWR